MDSVTKKNKLDQALKEAENRFEMIFNMSPDAMIVTNLQTADLLK